MATISKLFGTNVSSEQEEDALQRINKIYKHQKSEDGLTQKKLAKLMGIKEQSAVSQYLRGEITLNPIVVLNFAQAMNVSPMELYPALMEPIQKLFSQKN